MKTKILVNLANCETVRMNIVMMQWEYKVLPIKTRIHLETTNGYSRPVIEDAENELMVLGKEGWELVGIQDTSLQDGRIFTILYLKRSKST